MLDRNAAQCLAEAAQKSRLYAVDERLTEEHPFGWVFHFRPTPESGIDETEMFGLCPIIVDRNDGSVHAIGTREPDEEVVERYARTGSVYKDP